MSWNLYEVSDEVRIQLADLSSKSEWYDALGKLEIGQTGGLVCDLLEAWPLWIEATEHAPVPLRLLFIGELSARGGADPDVGFLGASSVQGISEALSQPESYFLDLLSKTAFAQRSETYRNQIALLPLLRDYYSQVAGRDNATVFLLD